MISAHGPSAKQACWHVASAARIVATLLERGTLKAGLSYSSAYSGIDTFAAAVDAAVGGAWRYEFASER